MYRKSAEEIIAAEKFNPSETGSSKMLVPVPSQSFNPHSALILLKKIFRKEMLIQSVF
jgi:hypothetical protein